VPDVQDAHAFFVQRFGFPVDKLCQQIHDAKNLILRAVPIFR